MSHNYHHHHFHDHDQSCHARPSSYCSSSKSASWSHSSSSHNRPILPGQPLQQLNLFLVKLNLKLLRNLLWTKFTKKTLDTFTAFGFLFIIYALDFWPHLRELPYSNPLVVVVVEFLENLVKVFLPLSLVQILSHCHKSHNLDWAEVCKGVILGAKTFEFVSTWWQSVRGKK